MMNANAPLLYHAITPLDAQKHARQGLRANLDLGFARGVHAVPINMIEFPQACMHYPVVFAPDQGATPVAVLGLTEQENLFVDQNGRWASPGAYIPAYIRRYPFLLAEVTGTDQLTLCIDDRPDILEAGGQQRFFDDQGTASAMTKNALEFCQSFYAASIQTKAFASALDQAGLLVTREAEIPLPEGRSLRFSGFRVIDENKWVTLPDQTFLEWRKKGWLPAIYAALFAGSQWSNLARAYANRHLNQAA